MSIAILAHLLLAAALLLALAFHRHRAAQVAVVLWLLFAGISDDSLRVQVGALLFAPWLLPLCVAVPEARLLSKRHALFVLLAVALAGIVLYAPPHVYQGLRDLVAAPFAGLSYTAIAALPCGVAALIAAARWLRDRNSMDAGLALALAVVAVACLDRSGAASWFAMAAAIVLVAIFHASYRMAFIDTLTGLPNRRALDETLSRLSGNYALAMIDVDHFKSFNDTHGHAAGDVVLREVAQGLHRHAQGRAFRYGGEEFCVVYGKGENRKRVAQALDRAREQIAAAKVMVPSAKKRKARAPQKIAVSVTISAGCACRNENLKTPKAVLDAADAALYKAKAAGRNRVAMG